MTFSNLKVRYFLPCLAFVACFCFSSFAMFDISYAKEEHCSDVIMLDDYDAYPAVRAAVLAVENLFLTSDFNNNFLDFVDSDDFHGFLLSIQNGVGLEVRESHNFRTPLIYASEIGNLNFIKKLIKAGVNINSKSRKHQTALMTSIIFNKEGIAHFLAKQNSIDLEQGDAYGRTGLIYAIMHGSAKIVKMLLKNGVNVNHLTHKNANAMTYAAILKKNDIVTLLLKTGVNINQKDDIGNTPLVYAAINKDYATIKLLIKKGALIDSNFLQTVVLNRDLELIGILFKHDRTIFSKSVDNMSVIQFAKSKNMPEGFIALLESMVNI